MTVDSDDFLRMVAALPDTQRADGGQYSSFSVRGKRFGYYWPRTQTVGLKQTLSEQRALVAERPDVFEEQFTAGGFGWVVVYLEGVDTQELSELVFEAWRLSAPDDLVAQTPDPADQPRRKRGRARS
ncbi:MmcQ/YjbR family DNA-binding protein [Actinokineospora sp. NBRC 105648]|uniref:MmcQ/YjbR family DNA-binding protein n=1 Tax=Actinokineospora sp. NBRC 105648 TaxID=3032206 RepID=UPI002556CE7D|nr:MmcQ/YjbR family DNA-binding protein [Actinokineospora sp. NBRC 105648]